MQREEERRSRRSHESDSWDLESVLSSVTDQVREKVELTPERRQLLLAELQTQICAMCKRGEMSALLAILDRDEAKMPQVVELLGPKGRVNVDAVSPAGETPLLSAVDGGQLEVVRMLLERGALVNKRGKDGVTPLHSAAGFGRLELAKVLIAKGAHSATDAEGDTPEDYARQFGAEEMLVMLTEWKADPTETAERYRMECDPKYAEDKVKREAADRAKREAAEKKAKDAERAAKEKERAAKEAKELKAAKIAAEERRKSITLS